MATINHKKYDEATETFKDFNVYDGKETLIFKVDGEGQKASFEKPVSFAGGLEGFVSNDQPAIYRAFSTTGSYPFDRYGDLVIQARSSHDRNIVFAAGTSPAVIASMTSDGLCFGSDTAAANALDDYEEGTWTPELRGSTGTPTGFVANYIGGSYTKIGRMVVARMGVNVNNVGTGGTGVLQVHGLPYTGANVGAYQEPTSAANGGRWVTASNAGNVYAFVKNGTSYVEFRTMDSNADTGLDYSEIQGGSASVGTWFTLVLIYFVS